MGACKINHLCVIVGDVEGRALAKSCWGNTDLLEKVALVCLEITAQESMPIGYMRREHAELCTCCGAPIRHGESHIDGGIVTAVSGSGASGDIEAIAKMVTGFVRGAIQDVSAKLRENANGNVFIA